MLPTTPSASALDAYAAIDYTKVSGGKGLILDVASQARSPHRYHHRSAPPLLSLTALYSKVQQRQGHAARCVPFLFPPLHPAAFVRTIGAYVRDCTFFPPRAALPAGAVLGFDSLQPPGWLAGVDLANADGTVGGCRWFSRLALAAGVWPGHGADASAGCTINDIADRNFDKHVKRTTARPITSGELSVKEAALVGAVLALLALGLVLTTRWEAVAWSCLPVLFTILYPYTKRFFAMPQAFLGIAFNFGIVIAFAAVVGEVGSTAWVLWLANMCMVLAYNTSTPWLIATMT